MLRYVHMAGMGLLRQLKCITSTTAENKLSIGNTFINYGMVPYMYHLCACEDRVTRQCYGLLCVAYVLLQLLTVLYMVFMTT